MSTKYLVNRVLWGVWQVDQPRPETHGAFDHRDAPND